MYTFGIFAFTQFLQEEVTSSLKMQGPIFQIKILFSAGSIITPEISILNFS